jgi:hypothetical protein
MSGVLRRISPRRDNNLAIHDVQPAPHRVLIAWWKNAVYNTDISAGSPVNSYHVVLHRTSCFTAVQPGDLLHLYREKETPQ